MGDFNEHVLFGLLTAFVTLYLLDGFFTVSGIEIIASASALLLGSVLPDIDHKKSKIHRSVRAVLSLSIGVLVATIFGPKLSYQLLIGITASSTVFLSFKLVKIRHRGFTHSISFLATVSSITAIISVISFDSFVPGIAMALGISSHLILDTEFKLT